MLRQIFNKNTKNPKNWQIIFFMCFICTAVENVYASSHIGER